MRISDWSSDVCSSDLAIDASGNNNAFRMLARDVANITAYCGRYAPELLDTQYAYEIWKLYQSTALRPDSVLTGRFVHDPRSADVDGVLRQIEEARFEAERRQLGRDAAEAEDARSEAQTSELQS